MSEAHDTESAGTDDEPTVAGVAAKLAIYVLPGAVAAMVVWEVFSVLLSGELPEGRIVWLAVGLLVVLAVAVAALRNHVVSRE